MRTGFRISSLVPSGLVFDGVSDSEDSVILAVRSEAAEAQCPLCATASRRVHSHYIRHVADLPSAGRKVRLRLLTRRFTCEVPHCRRRIFAERFGEDVVPLRRRRTARLEHIVHHLGLALGGRPAASFAKRLMLPVSNDTLLRVVRRRTAMPMDPLLVVGIDDWAFRRNRRYGTIVCDLERRRIVALLPDRETATVQAWLSKHPGINIVSRDRGGGYGEAAAKALPNAIQVADRWHLMENASAAFLDAVRRSMSKIRTAIGATTIDLKLLTCAEKLRYQGYLRRQDSHAAIAALVSDGVPLKEIVRRTGHSRNLVRQISRGGGTDIFRTRQSTLGGHLPFLDAQWSGGCRNGAELWRRLRGQGFKGSLRVVAEWATRRRRAETISRQQLQRVPAARTIAQLMTMKRDHLTKAETVTVAAIEQSVPMLADANALVGRFHAMIRKRAEIELEPWIDESKRSLIGSFANGIANDKGAVHAAITQPWSNGQVEAQITKLKLVKRQMYGRAKLDLLQARLIGAP
ncbi:ISL3 family transposase [Bradyrhizobium sp. SSUT77]|uniref:ISL3 family transposase n=1 Tax=Bradyrhizobium sp. SSUT77 TaxID=3040603 RepID=UPI00244A0957|nr:ISL3 family transposase [Bradyrhizobium sp. SSUT77]MDH2346805.1 ISL3 family transposase [Bradyrhizobium sp. SSUT77]